MTLLDDDAVILFFFVIRIIENIKRLIENQPASYVRTLGWLELLIRMYFMHTSFWGIQWTVRTR